MNYFTRNRSLFFKYLLSYILILLFPILLLVFFVNNQFLDVLKKDLIANNVNTLNRVMYVIDSNIKQFDGIRTHIHMNRSLKPHYLLNEPNHAIDAQNELDKYLASNSFIKEIVIYFRGDQFLYSSSSSYTIPFFINNAFRYSAWSEDDFKNDINSLKVPVIRPAEDVTQYDNQSRRFITFIYPIAHAGVNPTTTVLFLVDEKFFTEIMKNNFGEYNANILILDQNNQIITTSDNSLPLSSDSFKDYVNRNEPQFTEVISAQNKKFLLSVLKSKDTGWKYVSFTPVQEVLKETYSIQIKFVLVTMLLLLIGSIVIYYNMQINYKPIRNLKNYADKLLQHNNKPENEIDAAINTMDYLSNQNKMLISDTKTASKNFILESLLKGRIKTIEDLKLQGEPFDISFKNPFYFVTIILFDKNDSVINSQIASEILNKFEDKASLFFNGHAKDYLDQNRIVLIISLDVADCEGFREKLHDFQMSLKETFNTQTTIGVGNIYNDVKDIPLSYVEASAALDYRLIKGNGKIIFNDELSPQEDSLDSYPHKELDSLIYLIKQGNANEIEYALNNIINYIKTCNIPLFIARGLCFDMVNTIWKSFSEINKELLLSKNNFLHPSMLAEFETIDELTDLVKNMCFDICTFIRESKLTQDQSLIKDISYYIQSNFMNYDFSIQNMADHFEMTLTNISQYFKNQTGLTIIDYTTNLRMEKAKELLISSELNLNQISLQVGYLNSSSFIRRFKQVTGLTPGQYAKEKKNK